MRTLLLAALLGAVLLISPGAHAAGCTVTPAEPVCTYTAAGGEIARGGASSTWGTSWEAWVMRDVNGRPTKVVLAGANSLLDANPMGHPVPANPGELVTLELHGGMMDVPGGLVNIS